MRSLQNPAPMILMAPADMARAHTTRTSEGPVMEIVSFRLMPGIGEAEFLAAAQSTAAPLRDQRGYLGRSLTRAEDGTWTDHVTWSSLAMAMAGADVMMAEPGFQPFLAMIDPATVRMRHDPIRWQMD